MIYFYITNIYKSFFILNQRFNLLITSVMKLKIILFLLSYNNLIVIVADEASGQEPSVSSVKSLEMNSFKEGRKHFVV